MDVDGKRGPLGQVSGGLPEVLLSAKGRAQTGPFFVRADLWQTPSAEDVEELNFHLEGGGTRDGEPFRLVLLLPSLPDSTWAEWTKKWVV